MNKFHFCFSWLLVVVEPHSSIFFFCFWMHVWWIGLDRLKCSLILWKSRIRVHQIICFFIILLVFFWCVTLQHYSWFSLQPGYSLRTFMGHSASVMSLDFHPNKDDLICSCDGDGEIRYWSINNGSCTRVFKVESFCCWCANKMNRPCFLDKSRISCL